MDPDEVERAVEQARGYADLGMCVEAWDALESLPAEDRALPAALAVRLLVCVGLQRWEMGAEIVKRFGPYDPLPQREAAGRFYLAHAEALCAGGNIEAAKQELRMLSGWWPEGREMALSSKALAPIW